MKEPIAQGPVDVNVMPLRCKAVGGDIDMGIGMRAIVEKSSGES